MKKIFILFFSVAQSLAFAQSTFQKVFYSYNGSCVARQTSDGRFAVSIPHDSVFMKLDSSGNTLATQVYNFTIGTFIEDTDKSFVTGGVSEGRYSPDAVMARIDSSLDTIWTRRISSCCGSLGADVRKTEILPGGNLLFQVFDDAVGGPNSYDSYIRNPSGDFIRTFYNQGDDLILTQDKHLVSIFFNYNVPTMNINKKDTMGNTLWNKYISDSAYWWMVYSIYSIAEDTDNNYITGGFYGSSPNSQKLIMKINSLTGDTLFTKILEYGIIFDLIPVRSGGYAAVSRDSTQTILLTRYDQNLSIRWKRHYTPLNSTMAYQIEECIDGGFLISGDMIDSAGTYRPYLIKTDSLGNTSPLINIHDRPDNKPQFIIYPNPFHQTIELKILNYTIHSSKNNFQIFDLMGKEIYSKEINSERTSITIHSKVGIYFYRFSSSTGIIQTGKLIVN
jgi:hypothetical protein